MSRSDDLTGSDLSDIFAEINEDFPEENKPVRKKKSKSKAPLAIFIIVALILAAGGGYFYMKGEGESSKQAEPEKEKIDLQLVNTQQVIWADNLCSLVGKWQGGLNQVPEPNSDKGYTSTKLRDEASNVLKTNSAVLKQRGDEVLALIPQSYNSAVDFEQGTIITDNNLKVGRSPDEKVVKASTTLANSLKYYSQSLSDIADDLRAKSDYDSFGIRDKINDFKKLSDGMSDDLGNRIISELNDGVFDNLATMEKVSTLESCSNSFINSAALSKDKSEEIDKQKELRDFVNYQRCRQFLDNQDVIGNKDSESVKGSVVACEDLVSRTVIEDSNPFNSMDINSHDEKRALPKHIPANLEELGKNNPSAKNSISKTEESNVESTQNTSSSSQQTTEEKEER